jgi:hypothetical protein
VKPPPSHDERPQMSEPRESNSWSPIAKHFDGRRFYNPNSRQAPGLFGALRWKLTTRGEPSPRFVSDVNQSLPPRRVEGSELRATLVNHSTVLLQQRTSHILTDPIWSERTIPLSWIGPRRRRSTGVRLEDLPRIDMVLLSHNHYDHLDLRTLRWLAKRGEATFIVPTGVCRLLRSEKIGLAVLEAASRRTIRDAKNALRLFYGNKTEIPACRA